MPDVIDRKTIHDDVPVYIDLGSIYYHKVGVLIWVRDGDHGFCSVISAFCRDAVTGISLCPSFTVFCNIRKCICINSYKSEPLLDKDKTHSLCLPAFPCRGRRTTARSVRKSIGRAFLRLITGRPY